MGRPKSPLEQLLDAFDRLDADACTALFATDGRLSWVDGHVAEGHTAVRARLTEYFDDLTSMTHVVRDSWHLDQVWIAEIDASYVLEDRSLQGPVAKVMILRMRSEGIGDLRVYAAVEPSFHAAEQRHQRERDRGLVVGDWRLPPL
ncbi:MAG: nuclear transport factor 2 family protein [Actinomycetota bacterium]|nr:nuclear transport factor 2 family protein [Actinomycetota bacterium]